MDWSDFQNLSDFVAKIKSLEQGYAESLFHRVYAHAGNLQAWYNEANQVRETWRGKVDLSPKEASASWDQVGEIVVVGLIHRIFPDWSPIGLPVGSETRLSSRDAIIHIDVKTHKQGDPDLDRTQDVRPEQISGDASIERTTQISELSGLVEYRHRHLEDREGKLGSSAPKLPPFYPFGPKSLKVCLTYFAVCVYEFDAEASHQYLTRVQLFTVPNGLIRLFEDYTDIFRPGKDGRNAHRVRVKLPELAKHETWRWMQFRYEPHGVVIGL